MSQMHLISKPIEEDSRIYYKDLLIILKRKPYQKSLYLYIDKGDVTITCGLRLSLKEIGSFIDSHYNWISEEWKLTQIKHKKYPKKSFISGESFAFCGEQKTLKFCHGAKAFFYLEGTHLYGASPQPLSQEKWHSLMIQFYKSQGKSILTKKVNHYASIMNLHPKKLCFRSQKTLFGSCSEDGVISLNWTLVAAPHSVMDYVVVHELAHLRYLDHSPAFWNLVSKYQKTYLKQKKWVQEKQIYFDFLFKL